jgi:hypothetical protein
MIPPHRETHLCGFQNCGDDHPMGEGMKKCSGVVLPLTFRSDESKHIFHWMSTDAIQCESSIMYYQKLTGEK